MLNKLYAILQRDFIQRFSSRTELLFFLVLPIIFTTILGGALGVNQGPSRVEMAVANEDHSAAASAVVEALINSTTVDPVLLSREEAIALVEAGDVAGALLLPAGFGASMTSLEREGNSSANPELIMDTSSNLSLVIDQAVGAALSSVADPVAVARTATEVAMSAGSGVGADELRSAFPQTVDFAAQALDELPQYVTTIITERASENVYDNKAQASAGQMITWVLIPLLGTSALLTYERLSGTLRRLLVTPTRKSTYLFGTLSAQLVMGLIQISLLVGFGALVLGVDYGSSPLGLLLVLFTFALSGVALGTMMGTFTRTDSQASNLSIMLGMGMALLGGCWWPLELFPQGVQTAVKVLPTTWAMQGLTDIMMRGHGLNDVLLEGAVLTGFALLFFVIGVRRFRFE